MISDSGTICNEYSAMNHLNGIMYDISYTADAMFIAL
jgi:hypothetical protein